MKAKIDTAKNIILSVGEGRSKNDSDTVIRVDVGDFIIDDLRFFAPKADLSGIERIPEDRIEAIRQDDRLAQDAMKQRAAKARAKLGGAPLSTMTELSDAVTLIIQILDDRQILEV